MLSATQRETTALNFLAAPGPKQTDPERLLSGFSVNRSVAQFRNRFGSSAGRTRTYNQPVNSRLLYH